MDITKPLPFKDGTVEYILIEHCLEHVSGPNAFRFLREAYRVLMPEGTLRICVPELARLDQTLREDIICNHGHEIVFNFDLLVHFLTTAGFARENIIETSRHPYDGHWNEIGLERDTLETLRVEAYKKEFLELRFPLTK